MEAATFGEAQYIAICLGMHREDVSDPLIEFEGRNGTSADESSHIIISVSLPSPCVHVHKTDV